MLNPLPQTSPLEGAEEGPGTASEPPAVELIDISKSYHLGSGRRQVFSNVNLVFPRNRNVALLGLNGAGKSTLLRLIAGTEMPDEGIVLRHVSLSWPMGFTGGFHGSTTGRANVRFIARIYDADVDETLRFVEEFSELGPYLDEPVKTYSSGMRARLAFATSMAIDFDTYLVDEIIAVGDTRFSEKCARAFQERQHRSNIILVSHSLDVVRKYCDMAMVIAHGRVYPFDDLEEGIAAYQDILRFG